MFFGLENTELNIVLGQSDDEFYKFTKINPEDTENQKNIKRAIRDKYESLTTEKERELFKLISFSNISEAAKRNSNNLGFNFYIGFKPNSESAKFLGSKEISKFISDLIKMEKGGETK